MSQQTIEQPWRRLDIRMLLVHPVNELVRFFPALLVAFLVGDSGGNGGWWHFAAIAVPVLIGVGRFLTTRFRITATQLELSHGLLSRNVLTAPVDRVRTVELTSSPIHRLLGLAMVEIGTGSSKKVGSDSLKLNALPISEARQLRSSLIHNVGHAVETDTTQDDVLLRLDPSWVRYAPLTTSGVLVAGAALAAASQFIGPAIDRLGRGDVHLPAVPIAVAIVFAIVAFGVASAVLAILGYLVTNYNFTVSRDREGRSFHLSKGLFTTRETSLDSDRVRGLEIHEPLGLRLAGAGRLSAIATGLGRGDKGTDTLVPPAPRAVVQRVGAAILEEVAPFEASLTPHGPAARRRRFTRALLGALVLALFWLAVVLALDLSLFSLALVAVPFGIAVPLAADRYRRLGHGLVGHWFLASRHSLRGRRDALDVHGIIGWSFGQSWFQRRQGLTNLTATTSAGAQAYGTYDLPESSALDLVRRANPGLIDPFLT